MTTSITLLACTVASELSNEELELFIAMLNQLEDTLITISVARGADLALRSDETGIVTSTATSSGKKTKR